MSFLQRTPFFRLLLPMLFGILLYQWLIIPKWLLGVLIGVSVVIISLSFLLKNSFIQYKFQWLSGFGIFLFFIVLSYYLSFTSEQRNKFSHLYQEGWFLVELSASPVEKQRSYLGEVTLLQFRSLQKNEPAHGKAHVYFQKDSLVQNLGNGDKLLLKTEFTAPVSLRNPDGFNYGRYLKRQGINGSCYVTAEDWVVVESNKRVSLWSLADDCRNYVLNIYKRYGITGKEYAVLAALTLGYKDELDPDLKSSYSSSGAMHILAVSGLHVGIIYAVLAFLLSFMDKSSRLLIFKAVLSILFLWIYAFITGLSPSVLRATFMFSLVALGNLTGRKSQIYNTVFMSAFILLLINPDLLFSVSFQLSYSAVLSIIYFQPKIARIISIKNKYLRWVWELTAVSLAAQLGTAPFVLYYFQSFPNYFLFSNLIVIPAATIVLYLAVVLFAVSFIPFLAVVIAQILKWLLFCLNHSMEFIETLPCAVSIMGLNTVQTALLFMIIIFIAYYLQTKKFTHLVGTCCCMMAFFLIHLHIHYDTVNTRRLIVYESYRDTHINILNGNQNFIYTTNEEELYRTASGFWTNRKILPPRHIEEYPAYTDGFLVFNNKRILILEDNFSDYTISEPIVIDCLIIGNGLKPKIDTLLNTIHPAMIICDNTINSWYTEQIRKACEEKSIAFYSTKESGFWCSIIKII